LGVIKFHVPISEQRGSDMNILDEFKNKEIPAQLLIRWLSKEYK